MIRADFDSDAHEGLHPFLDLFHPVFERFGIVSGNGARSKGKYTGVATGANLLGVSAGDLSLFHVLEGYDYILSRGLAQGVRVVNCSFSADTEYNPNDPVNVATKLLTERGVSVVFSAGNTGPGLGTLNCHLRAEGRS